MKIGRGFGTFLLLLVILSSYLVYGLEGFEESDNAAKFNSTPNSRLSIEGYSVAKDIKEKKTFSSKRILSKSESNMNNGGSGAGGGGGRKWWTSKAKAIQKKRRNRKRWRKSWW